MPGAVLAVSVAEGDTVVARQPLLVIEAMKMEYTIAAPADGVVSELAVCEGQQGCPGGSRWKDRRVPRCS
jgi:biotin carboxyl carrier protein